MKPRWLEIAELELLAGIAEIPGPGDEPRIVLYHGETTLPSEWASQDETPWCSSFANYCVAQAGLEPTRSAAARSWLRWGVAVSTEHIPHGAIGIFSRGSGLQPGPEVLDAPGHVGFIVGRASLREVLLLAGNQADAVNIKPYPIERLLGVRWAA